MWELLLESIRETGVLEYITFTFLVLYVYFATRQKPVAWLLGMAGVVLFAIIDYQEKLYAEIPLQGLYFVLSVYGWYEWKYGGKRQTPLPVTFTSLNIWMAVIILGVVGTIIIGYLQSTYLDASLPYLDGGTTAFSLAGTWMLARKKLENWVLWFFVDGVYAAIFIHKGLLLIALLYIIYVIFSVVGLVRWRRSMHTEKNLPGWEGKGPGK